MAHTISHVYTKHEIKRNAELIQSIFQKLGTKVKLGHALEVCSIIAGHKNWDTASAVAPNEDREVTIIIGAPGSGKTTFIQNAIDTDENTLVIDYNGEYKRCNQTFDNAHILPLRDANDANLIIKILPSFTRIVMEEAPLVFLNYPDLFAHVIYGRMETIITAVNDRALEAAGIVFSIEPEVYFTVSSQSIAVYEFINPRIGLKEYELLSPLDALEANSQTHTSSLLENVRRRESDIAQITAQFNGEPSQFPLAVIGYAGTGKSIVAKKIAGNTNMRYLEFLYLDDSALDIIHSIKSAQISTPTLIFIDTGGTVNPNIVKKVLDDIADDNIRICVGLYSEEIFNSLYEQINFFGVIRADHTSCIYEKLTRRNIPAPKGFQKTANHASYEKHFNSLVSMCLGVGANLIDAQMASQWYLENIWVGMANVINDGNNGITIKNADVSSCDGIKVYFMSQVIYTMINHVALPHGTSPEAMSQYHWSHEGYGKTEHGKKHLLDLVKENRLYDEKLLAFLEISEEKFIQTFESLKTMYQKSLTRHQQADK